MSTNMITACNTSPEMTLPSSDIHSHWSGATVVTVSQPTPSEPETENALLEALVARRRDAIARDEAAYQAKLQAERDAECHRLDEVLTRLLSAYGV